MMRAAFVVVVGVTLTMSATPLEAQESRPVVVVDGNGFIDTSVTAPGSPGAFTHGSSTKGMATRGKDDNGVGASADGAPQCEYLRLPQLDTAGPPALEAYRYICEDGTAGHVAVPAGGRPAPAAGPGRSLPLITPGDLAQQAFNTLELPTPDVRLSPDGGAGRYQLVGFPTWWWVENFQPLSQRTSAGAVWARVTATPVYSTFDGGEGHEPQLCQGPGVRWREGLPEHTRGACTYIYQRAAETVTATVTVTWRVTWVGSGDTAGELPLLRRSAVQPLTVYERQAVVTSG
jgi:hypothetical protein